MKPIFNHFSILFLSAILCCGPLRATSYTYVSESFEGSEWSTASSSANSIEAPSGTWTVAKNNVRKTDQAYDGQYSLYIATKTNALVTPMLENGAGVLTFAAKRTSGTRWLAISTSTDKTHWSQAIDSISVPNEWTMYSIQINNPKVRYVRFQLQSNGSFYIDDIRITKGGSSHIDLSLDSVFQIGSDRFSLLAGCRWTDGDDLLAAGCCYATHEHPNADQDSVVLLDAAGLESLKSAAGHAGLISLSVQGLSAATPYYVRAFIRTADGYTYSPETAVSTRPEDEPMAYFHQTWEKVSECPTGGDTPQNVTVEGQGQWIYCKALRGTNSSYITDGSSADLRMPKNGSYLITPLLDSGVSHFSFTEGRGRDLRLYLSTDGGSTWTLIQEIETKKGELCTIRLNRKDINRLKIANESGSDADLDNLSVYCLPQGRKASFDAIAADSVGRNFAHISARLQDAGDNSLTETGICWSQDEQIPFRYDKRVVCLPDTDRRLSAEISGLRAQKPVYVRAYAVSKSGVGYSDILTFSTLSPIACQTQTLGADSVRANAATLKAAISDDGGDRPETFGFYLAPGAGLSLETLKTADFYQAVRSDQDNSFSLRIKGLAAQTVYSYAAVTRNAGGEGCGQVRQFTTGAFRRPAVEILSATDIQAHSATVRGRLSDNGNRDNCCVRIVCTYSGSEGLVEQYFDCSDDCPEGDFVMQITSLKAGQVYQVHIEAYAAGEEKTADNSCQSSELTFTTSSVSVFHLSPEGDDATADGSPAKPYYSLSKVVDLVNPGDSIVLEAGVYRYSQRVNIGVNGQKDNEITLCSRNGRAILDFSAMADADANQGIRHCASYWHYCDIDIAYAGDNGLLIERNKPTGGSYEDIVSNSDQAHHNLIERCRFYGNRDTGLQLKNLATYNFILNCDSYDNRDSSDGDADGFAPKVTVGNGNVFFGCRAWNNSDDGWDSYLKCAENHFPDDIYSIVENCWAFKNGFLADNTPSEGNGNGFKLGGNYERHNMVLIDCLAFDNLQKSFDQNHNAGDMTLINCSGFDHPYNSNKNRYQYRIDEDEVIAQGKTLTLTNCVAVWDGLEAKKTAYSPVSLMNKAVVTTCRWQTSPADYLSTDTSGVRSARQADGSLPDIPFMKPAAEGSLIDAGTALRLSDLPASVQACLKDVALQLPQYVQMSRLRELLQNSGDESHSITFCGAAPDLGYRESTVISSLKQGPHTSDLQLSIAGRQLQIGLPQASQARLQIVSVDGKILENRQVGADDRYTMDLPAGIYQASLSDGNSRICLKFRLR